MNERRNVIHDRMTSATPAGYILGRGQRERKRLLLQASILKP